MDVEKNGYLTEARLKPKYSENNYKPMAHTAMIILLVVGIIFIIVMGALIGTGQFEAWAAAEAAARAENEPIPYPEGGEYTGKDGKPETEPAVTEPEPGKPVTEPEPGMPVTEPEPGMPITEPEPANPVTEPEPAKPVTEPEPETSAEPASTPESPTVSNP